MKPAILQSFRPKLKHLRTILASVASVGKLAPGRLTASDGRQDLDRQYYLKLHWQYGPIFKVWHKGKITTCILGHALARRFLKENADSLQVTVIDMKDMIENGFLRAMEGEIYAKYRKLLVDAFSRIKVANSAGELRAICRANFADIMKNDTTISNAQLTVMLKKLSTELMLVLIFGLQPESDEFDEIFAAFDRYFPDGMQFPINSIQMAAYHQICDFIRSKSITPHKNVESDENSIVSYFSRQGTCDETIIGNLVQLTQIVRFDMHGLFRWMVVEAARHGEICDRMAGEKIAAKRREYSRAYVLETLRNYQSEFLYRTVIKPVRFEGYLFPKKSLVRISVWEGHQDEIHFPSSGKFDPERFLRQNYSADQYAPMGMDHHRCLGAHWVTALGSLFIEELVENYSLELIADGDPVKLLYHFDSSPDVKIAVKAK